MTGMSDAFVTLSHRLFKKFAAKTARIKSFVHVYEQSGLPILFETYIELLLLISTITAVSTFCVAMVLHFLVLRFVLAQSVTASVLLATVAALLTASALLIRPVLRRNKNKNDIETNLVYTTGYLGVLAAGGLTIEKLFERAAEVEQHKALKELVTRFITNVRMFGADAVTSMDDVSNRSPSDMFSKLANGLSNAIKTSGDLQSLLIFETKRLLHTKREQLKKTMNTLMTIGEVYVAAVVMFPTAIIIMLSLLSILGSTMMGLSSAEQLNLLIFAGLPMISVVFLLIFDNLIPEAE
jgi:archaellum biogenesis protein FlaJ (TadC family)